MVELVEYLAKSLVEHPSAVRTNERILDETVIIELTGDEGDMGKVIGKQGRIAKAIRSIVKAASVKTGKKYMVEIV